LLITLTLIAFLVVLLVGLAAYTRIETAIAGNTQRQAQARQNAILALDVALARLQQAAGPDRRVTATAESIANVDPQKKYYTGVWNNEDVSAAPVFLASGTSDVTTAISTARRVELAGAKSTGSANNVVAELEDIATVGVPGARPGGATPATIGRYAWWVGDQGVKAPVELPDNTDNIAYPPYDSAELRSRIRQQISLGAGAANADGTPVFEPRDTTASAANPSNNTLASRMLVPAQMAFFKNASGTAIGLAPVQSNFHAWSANNFAVLTNTKLGGLRQDLSLFSPSNPSPLGAAYDAWADYKSYMEDPAGMVSSASPPLPAFSADSLRRRYVMQPARASYPIGPVLSFFGMSFSLHNDTTTNSPTKLIASVRCVVELWNPYSSALVPEDLAIVIKGLPVATIISPGAGPNSVDLQDTFKTSDGTVKFSLPFSSDGQNPDRSSWLPGRVYDWSAQSSSGDPGARGYEMQFYVRNAQLPGDGVERDAGSPIGPNTIRGVQQRRTCSVTTTQTLTIELCRASTGDVLAQYTSPTFDSFTTDPSRTPGGSSSDFAYVFRLPDSNELPTGETEPWLQSAGRDVRETSFPVVGRSGFVVSKGQPPDPALVVTVNQSGFPAAFPDLLLDRYTDAASQSYNEDVPVFELPRTPLLSVGSLQHLRIPGAQPFTIGNSWASGVQLNGIDVDELFDRFFFSGLAEGVAPAIASGAVLLPNPLLKILRNPLTGSVATVSDLRSAPASTSSKFMLQSGAFNLNSANKAAWIGMLRSVRFPASQGFAYLDADASTGTGDDSTTTLGDPLLANSRITAFPRFAQSAQEVFEADANYTQSQFGGSTSVIDTPLFRRGLRVLSTSDVAALADQIVILMRQRHATSGPFRSLQEFLEPVPLLVGASGRPISLLEKAVEAANLNDASKFDTPGIEFSSQFLTQADIMTALAPVLFPRSDTFVIRAYGEALNPATSTATAPVVEGRAWCEAVVQRVPEYFDAAGDDATVAPDALTSRLNAACGRRFKIVSFRWLTRSDI
jgi:hypothetical protein